MEKPERPATAPKRRFKLLDTLVGLIFLVICVFLVATLAKQLSLHHEVNAAKAVSNRVITDIGTQNASDARSLGDTTFQDQNSVAILTAQFTAVASHAHGKPVIDRQTLNNDKSGQAVAIIYKYPDKPLFYIRVLVTRPKGASQWHMVSLTGNPSEKSLL